LSNCPDKLIFHLFSQRLYFLNNSIEIVILKIISFSQYCSLNGTQIPGTDPGAGNSRQRTTPVTEITADGIHIDSAVFKIGNYQRQIII
jgi:hypothetical protein